jgi:hypothetical protein
MSYDIPRTSRVANQMLEISVPAGAVAAVAAVLTIGLAEGIGRLVAWNGRQRLASGARQHCRAVEQFTKEMTGSFIRLARELDVLQPGLTVALTAGLSGLRERNMWFLEENYRAFVLRGRGRRPGEIQGAIGRWVVEPLRVALDGTRKTVGRRFHENQLSVDRRQLNESIRRTENDLVECAFRFLHTDVARPGEGGDWRRKRTENLLVGLVLVLGILALPIGWSSNLPPSGRGNADKASEVYKGKSTIRHAVPASQLRDFRTERNRYVMARGKHGARWHLRSYRAAVHREVVSDRS